MPIILAGFVLLPFLLGAVIQYAVCRFTRRKRWWVLPGLAAAVLALLIAAGRWNLWASEQVSPLTQVLFFPGLPALALLAGLFAGWRFWKWFWRPRVVDGR